MASMTFTLAAACLMEISIQSLPSSTGLYDKYDQLRAEMRSDRVFYGFQASSPPTSRRPTRSRAIS